VAAPLIEELKSILVYPETDVAPSHATPRKVTVDNSTINSVGSADLAADSDDDFVLYVLEALDGNVKNQYALITSMNSTSDVASITPFAEAPSGLTQCNLWDFKIPRAVVTSNSLDNTGFASTLRTEADDYWNKFKALFLEGVNQELANITDFAAASDEFTVTSTSSPVVGDAVIPVQPIQPSDVTIEITGGAPLERQIITDTLAVEGVIVGAQDGVSVQISPEIRGLSNSAGDDTEADSPDEVHVFMDSVFDKSLGTGGLVDSPTNANSFSVTNASVDKYDLVIVNGEMGAVLNNAATFTMQSNHLSSAPVSGDEIFGTCTYKPKDTGHTSVGFMCFTGDKEMGLISGGMPSVSFSLEGNTIAKYSFNFSCVGGFWATRDKAHDDIYDTTKPIAVKSNICRVLIDGVELDADVMSISGELIPAPTKRNAAFGALENNGGHFYTTRAPSLSMEIYMEDSSYWKKYRSGTEFDILVQVGSVPGNCWGLWGARAQLVEPVSFSASDGQMTQTLSFRLLRPTTAGMPDFVVSHG
jgi:hypothetical protein